MMLLLFSMRVAERLAVWERAVHSVCCALVFGARLSIFVAVFLSLLVLRTGCVI